MEEQNMQLLNITIIIIELIFIRSIFMMEIMGFKGVWIFQKRLYEGTVTCWKGLFCVCVSSPFR